MGYVVSKFKRARTFQLTYLAQIRQSFGDQVFQTAIPDLARFERSVDEGIPITLHSPSSHAAGIARQFFDEFTVALPKNTTQSAAVRAQSAISREPQLAFDEDDSHVPARQDGRVPLRNTYRIELP